MLSSFIINQAIKFQNMENEMQEEFTKRAEEAKKKYWDACKYPRKTKKSMRKEALADYELYMILAKSVNFTF